jgi:GNAT superfamily N-acetyltransferase
MASVLRSLSALLPLRAQRFLWLRGIGFDAATVEGITFKIATTASERVQACELLHDAYSKRGILEPSAARLRVTAHTFLPRTAIFVAVRAGRVLGTMSLVEDSFLGLPLEEAFGAEVARVRSAAPGRLAEVGSLAVTSSVRKRGVSLMLHNIMYRWAELRGIRALLIAVSPDAAPFYEALLFFERFTGKKPYGRKLDVTGVALRLDLERARAAFRAAYGEEAAPGEEVDPTRNLNRFFTVRDFPELALPDGDEAPGWSEDELVRLVASGRLDLSTFSPRERSVLASLYPRLGARRVRAKVPA